MTHKQLEDYLLKFDNTRLEYPFDDKTAVYKVGDETSSKMFALIAEGSSPLRVSLKCDPLLAESLRQKYETVVPGYHLSKKHWNTIICSGQLSDDEIFDLARLSYDLARANLTR